jgi:hypothetical protein
MWMRSSFASYSHSTNVLRMQFQVVMNMILMGEEHYLLITIINLVVMVEDIHNM